MIIIFQRLFFSDFDIIWVHTIWVYTQIEGLHKLVPVTKENYFSVLKIDREEDKSFYFRFVYVFVSLSVNKGIYMDSMQKSGQK